MYLTLQNIVLGISVLFLAWYIVGQQLNRRRAEFLLRELRHVLKGMGISLAIQWYGRSAFEIVVADPVLPLTTLKLFCLLEPRDFALAWGWNRLRRRRDQVVIHASYVAPPPGLVRWPLTSYGIPGLTSLETSGTEPHLRLTMQVGTGGEDAIRQAVDLVRHYHMKKRA